MYASRPDSSCPVDEDKVWIGLNGDRLYSIHPQVLGGVGLLLIWLRRKTVLIERLQ